MGRGEPQEVRGCRGAMPDGHIGKHPLVLGGNWTGGDREVGSLSGGSCDWGMERKGLIREIIQR